MGVGSYSQVENRREGWNPRMFPKVWSLGSGKTQGSCGQKHTNMASIFFPACGVSSMQSPLTFAPSETKSLQYVSIDGGAKHFFQFVHRQ